MVGCSKHTVIAHDTVTCAIIWQKEVSGRVWTLRVHGGVAIVPVSGHDTLVIDVSTGHQVHAMPSAGENVYGLCVFDGLISHLIFPCFCFFLHRIVFLAPLTKLALKVDYNAAHSGY